MTLISALEQIKKEPILVSLDRLIERNQSAIFKFKDPFSSDCREYVLSCARLRMVREYWIEHLIKQTLDKVYDDEIVSNGAL